MIKIYAGHGTSKIAPTLMKKRFEAHNHVASLIDANQLRKGLSPDNTSLLIFGGQSVTQFKEALSQQGIKAIKDYVYNGGHYVGICAGGYFGAQEIDFTGQDLNSGDLYKKQAQGLGFFSGLASGSLTEIAATPFTGMSDSVAVPTLETGQQKIPFKSLYWGGPQFIMPDKSTNPRILSTFKSATGTEIIMGVQCKVGENGGKATLLGYHPEISVQNIKKWILPEETLTNHTAPINKAILLESEHTFGIDYAFTIFRNQLGLTEGHKQPHQDNRNII